MNELEKKIQEQFGAELMIHDSFNPYSSLFKIKFPPHFHVLFEVEKAYKTSLQGIKFVKSFEHYF